MKKPDFDISGRTAVITGAGGVLGSNIAGSLIDAGVKVVMLDIRPENLEEKYEHLKSRGNVSFIVCDVLDHDSLRDAAERITKEAGNIDILINAAGGNMPGATLPEDKNIFDMKIEDFRKVNELNLDGTVLPCMVFGKAMAQSGKGSIVNISSMAADAAITRVPGYSTAKSGINIFTKWLAVELASKFGDKIRVNAIAPGFFIGDQNRAVLINPDGSYTERSEKILARTPMKRFGDISELNGIIRFLCSDAASFITGTVIPVDGGFSAFSGV